MNLKESFRYQNFLEKLMNSASISIQSRSHSLKVTKTHFKHKANPDAHDMVEEVENDSFFENDKVILFMQWLVKERSKLSDAIALAKNSLDFNLDSAIETNKFRQKVSNSIRSMLQFSPSKTNETGRDYKFNVEGNQTSYYYDIEVVSEEAYNRDSAKNLMRSMISEADEVSAKVDAAMINTNVDYEVVFDVNDSFEDVMNDFIAKILTQNN